MEKGAGHCPKADVSPVITGVADAYHHSHSIPVVLVLVLISTRLSVYVKDQINDRCASLAAATRASGVLSRHAVSFPLIRARS